MLGLIREEFHLFVMPDGSKGYLPLSLMNHYIEPNISVNPDRCKHRLAQRATAGYFKR